MFYKNKGAGVKLIALSTKLLLVSVVLLALVVAVAV